MIEDGIMMAPLKFTDKNGPYLIIAPHCDDELLACGGVIQQALENDIEVRVIFLTNGDGFRWAAIRNFKRPYINAQKFTMLGRIRQKEAIAAADCLGLNRDNIYFLAYPDGGLKNLWSDNWDKSNPFTSRYTKSSTNPYSLSYKVKQEYTGENLINNLDELIYKIRPEKIFVPSSYDNHPDHWAAYNFIKYVLVKLKMEDKIKNFPEVNQYLVHWYKWPLTLGAGSTNLKPPVHLKKVNKSWKAIYLTDRQKELKFASLKKYRTQINVMKKYLESFIKSNEIFICDDWKNLYIRKTDIDNNGGIQIPSINKNVIFYEPYRNNNKIKKRIGTDIQKIKLDLSQQHLLINLIFLNKYFPGQEIRIRAILLSKGRQKILSKDFELIIPGRSNKIVINQYINSHSWLKSKMIDIKRNNRSIKVKIENPGIEEGSYLFITAEIYRRGRAVDRTSWKIIRVIN